MYFANPWGLLGLLALPAILAIHLYHRRFPPLLIAGTHLWGAETETRSPGRKRERLPITATLLLELLAALLLTLVLSQPRFGALDHVTHLVAVLDNSASMQGAAPEEKSFRDSAIAELRQRVSEMPRGSVVTLILTGRRPVMLAGPAVRWEEAEPRLADWQPMSPRHEFQPAWDLASQLADDGGRLLFFTNRLPDESTPMPRQMEVVSFGRKLDNVAVTAARWTFDPVEAQGRVFVRVENFGRDDASVTVRATAGPQTVFSRSVTISAGQASPLEAEVPGGLGRIEISLSAPNDGLQVDNRVTLIEPKVRMLSVAVTLPEDSSAARPVRRVLSALPNINPSDVEAAHLQIGPAHVLPPSRRDLWWLGIGPLNDSDDARGTAKDLIGPYLLEKRNPLLEDVVLGGVVWGGVQPVELDVAPLISAGQFPLLSRLNGTQTTAYLLNIDLGRSNLPESPDWPILLGNLVELRRENLPGLRRWNYRLNEEVRFRLFDELSDAAAAAAGDLQLVSGNKRRPLARTSLVEVPPLDEPGIYRIYDGREVLGEFAVNFFDVHESDMLDLLPGNHLPAEPADAAAFALDNPYSWLILAAIVVIIATIFADWFVLKSRRLPAARSV